MAKEEYTPQFSFDNEKNEDNEIKTCMWCGRKAKGLVLVNDLCPECAKKFAASQKNASHISHISEEESISDFSKKGSGKLIQLIAVALMIIGIAASFIAGIEMCIFGDQLILPGILVIIIGSISSWITMTILRGFGELVETNLHIEKLLKKIAEKQ